MEQGFCIYPKKVCTECVRLSDSAKEMLTYKKQLENVKQAKYLEQWELY